MTKRGKISRGQKALSEESAVRLSELLRHDSARYIADMLISLKGVAVKEDMQFLAYLLEMACSEASMQCTAISEEQGFFKN